MCDECRASDSDDEKEKSEKRGAVAWVFAFLLVTAGVCPRLAITVSGIVCLFKKLDSPFVSVFVMSAIVCLLNITTVYKAFILDTGEFYEQMEREKFAPDERPNYRGAIRLGAQLNLAEEIYSSLLVSCLHPIEVKNLLDEVNFK